MSDLESALNYLTRLVREFVEEEHLTPPPIGWDKALAFGFNGGQFILQFPYYGISEKPDRSADIRLYVNPEPTWYPDNEIDVSVHAHAYKLDDHRRSWGREYIFRQVVQGNEFEGELKSALKEACTDLISYTDRLDEMWEESQERLRETFEAFERRGIEVTGFEKIRY